MPRRWTRAGRLGRRSHRGGTLSARRTEARNQFLVELDDATRPLIDPEEITATAARLLGQHLHVNRCAYAHVPPGETSLEIGGDFTAGVSSIVGRYPLAAFGDEFARAMRAGVAFAIGDTETDPRAAGARPFYRGARIRALLSVPLHKRGALAGSMALHQITPRRWRADELELTRLVANRCWESIERARVTRNLVRRAGALRLLADAGTLLLADEHPERAISEILRQVADLPELDLALHYRASRDGRTLVLGAAHGLGAGARARVARLPSGAAGSGALAPDREPSACAEAPEEGPLAAVLRELGVQAFCAVPLAPSAVLLGTLVFGSRTRDRFEQEELEFLRTLSHQIASACGRATATLARRDSEERLQQAVAVTELGTFELDLRTGAVIVNAQGRAIYGWDPGEPIVFDRVVACWHPDDRARVLATLDAAMAPGGPGTFDIEQRIVRRDGAERWIRVRGRAWPSGSGGPPDRCVGSYIDVTERKLAEARREQVLQAERAARAEAERVARLKDEFLATVSHELRTPLNAMLGWAQLILRRPMERADLLAAVETIDRNARAQGELIDDLLDMSRIVSGRIRLEMARVDMAAVAERAMASILPAAGAKGLQLETDGFGPGLIVTGDAARLQQVVWNLLSNAVKFTPPGGRIDVGLREDEGRIELSVTDTGVGISREFLPHVFEAFRQQDASTTRAHGGLGLGLSIVKQLVDLHGGQVHAASAGPGAGTRIVVQLPAGARERRTRRDVSERVRA